MDVVSRNFHTPIYTKVFFSVYACLSVPAFIMVMAIRKIDWLEHVSCRVSGYKLRNGRDDVIFVLA